MAKAPLNHHNMSAEIELLKEQQRSKQLYEMCENLWQILNVASWEYRDSIKDFHMAAIKESLTNNNPSKLKSDD